MKRFYRNQFDSDRFSWIEVSYRDSDIWVGVSKTFTHDSLKRFIYNELIKMYHLFDKTILNYPEFKTSLVPLKLTSSNSLIGMMLNASNKTNTGPMAAVAGAVAQTLGNRLIQEFSINELMIENGGDLFLAIQKPIHISVYAGDNTFSGKVGIQVLPEHSPLGICTSSGMFGPSLSFGKADAVMVACHDAALADAYATSIANLIKTEEDVMRIASQFEDKNDILSSILIKDSKLAMCGKIPLKIFSV